MTAMYQNDSLPSVAPAPVPESMPATLSLGSRAHVRQLFARAHAAVQRSGAVINESATLLTTSAALLDKATDARQQSAALQAELRASVTAYVLRLRRDDVPPERVLVLVKEMVRDVTPPASPGAGTPDLLDDVVRWSVDAYYAAAPAPRPDRGAEGAA